MTDRHVMRQAGGEVIIENGKVVDATETLVKWCPLHKILYGKDVTHTKEFIKEHVRMKIKKVGMFTKDRNIESEEDLVPFGASEMLMSARRHNIIDCAVLACDCAGTVIAPTPKLIQGIGIWMGGLIKTSPINEVIQLIQNAGGIVIDSKNASINQINGVEKSFEHGFKKVAVTIAGKYAHLLPKFRRIEKKNNGTLVILMVCNSGVKNEEAELMTRYTDMVWACASRAVWDKVGPQARLQIGLAIPVFVLTELGKDIVEKRAAVLNRPVSLYTDNLPRKIEKKCPWPLI